MSRRTSLKLTDERERQLERASEIVASGPDDDQPMSVVIDAALAHLVESEEISGMDETSMTLTRFSNSVTHPLLRSSIGQE